MKYLIAFADFHYSMFFSGGFFKQKKLFPGDICIGKKGLLMGEWMSLGWG